MPKLIDPIVVKEECQRLVYHKNQMETGVNAAHALLWFKEYASKEPVLIVTAKPIASSTPNADTVSKYVDDAAKAFAKEILNKAIEAAQHDLELAEFIRRKDCK